MLLWALLLWRLEEQSKVEHIVKFRFGYESFFAMGF